ncbi:membrane protein insertion efficiency factor YidD [Fructilactobacillus sanfranciscensis]|uniref:membrane protein insertion efficiency factor YidD n=1 Tax=Fructilactobacillus sanfranciscensis TaxID=1625 RepID=UPI0031F9ED00
MLKRLSVFIIHLYQKYVSAYTPASCRYQPTCSNYMQIAIEQFGFFLGILMGLSRVIRCNPFVKGGYDPVPTYFSVRRNNQIVNNLFLKEKNMSRKQKEIEIKVINDSGDENVRLVQINNQTVGTISENDGKFDVIVGENTFHEKNEEEALHQVIREFNLHQR